MGGGQSIFYPDNPKRRDRAEQLANDCKYYADQWDTKRADLERELGPYKAKLDRVLAAFGCQTVEDLDRVVQERTTGQTLDDWNKTKGSFDKTQVIDQIIMGAMGVIAISGLAISAVGALAGGFGFFVGLAVTADILLVFGIIGAIFDIINGAIQRDKLRDAITQLFTDRLRCKQSLAHIDNLYVWLPSIKEIYQTFEDLGYSDQKIIDRFKKRGVMKPLQEDLDAETLYKVASDLHDMDTQRGSWTNEDPNWRKTAASLEAASKVASKIMSNLLDLTIPGNLQHLQRTAYMMTPMTADITDAPPNYHDAHIDVLLSTTATIPAELRDGLTLKLKSFSDEVTAEVVIETKQGRFLGIDDGHIVDKSTVEEPTLWLMGLVNPSTESFLRNASFDPSNVSVDVFLGANVGTKILYLGEKGILVETKGEAMPLKAEYANV
ncbi:hypothetical protein EUX98_g49 [Antrodiella citrinella]|uniref:Uncharacterized protein n=1 Tax=Antrodiella citrinella TaxID=2447956 RepID=A0A4S4N7B4_9APHY|nr:hypothetical protein EUX98_g49 [Antrodiella citrinella]